MYVQLGFHYSFQLNFLGYGKKCCTINNIYPTKEESRGPLKHFSEVGRRLITRRFMNLRS
ncbi:hypothetical protein RhiirA4_16737 [Rhizophagus irregularis]|uniref:Uncharacterized protein n=1 Tax=Rhizophagus irregularis TaxID=588596 RepID=A0A2I1G288_9GLOM|nr:hypothetical protein RhiirA4_16737 [Rhizophagus irregularis]